MTWGWGGGGNKREAKSEGLMVSWLPVVFCDWLLDGISCYREQSVRCFISFGETVLYYSTPSKIGPNCIQ